jgi:hypothetical protein
VETHLVDATFVSKGIGPNYSFVGLHYHATVVADHLAGGVDVHWSDASPKPAHLVLTAGHSSSSSSSHINGNNSLKHHCHVLMLLALGCTVYAQAMT